MLFQIVNGVKTQAKINMQYVILLRKKFIERRLLLKNKMACMIKNVIFDLDGTLIDSADDIIDCLKKAYSTIPEMDNVMINRAHIGPPLSETIKKITPHISEIQFRIIVNEFKNCYDNSSYPKTRAYEGVHDLLNKLASFDKKIFIVTNKRIIPTRRLIKNLKIESMRDVITPDLLQGIIMDKTEMLSHLIRKWDINKKNTLMVGDSASDVIAAHNNGIISAVILNGYGDIKAVNESEPDYIIEKIEELYDLIYKINGDMNL